MAKHIEIAGAKLHNLKNISLNIPLNKLVVITGLSGSGKSSLAFDTLYAEGQRRYVESLSSYARQFLTRIDKPEVDHINGIPPAIAIEQKVKTRNSRSTVGTSTEIYEYLKILYARLGKTYSPISGKEVQRHSVTDAVDAVCKLNKGDKLYVTAGVTLKKDLETQLNTLSQQGFVRVWHKEGVQKLSQLKPDDLAGSQSLHIIIDRLKINAEDEDFKTRLSDSIQTAFYEGGGSCQLFVETASGTQQLSFSNSFEADGMQFEEPSVHLFSFNNPMGACPECKGTGRVFGVDEKLVIPDKSLSIYEKAVACWRGDKTSKWLEELIMGATAADFPIHKPYYELSQADKDKLWQGTASFNGIYDFFKYVEKKIYKIQYRVMYARYRGESTCPTCSGARLRKEASYVKINQHSIHDLVHLPIEELDVFFQNLELPAHEAQIAERLLYEIRSRIGFLMDVGLPYLTLNRLSATLSGGESQRINLACNLGSGLVGSLYILDEPSIGLHSRDTAKLIGILKKLRDLGNTVVVVEHDEEIIRVADEVIDLGPYAGELGGELLFQGKIQELLAQPNSLTADYLTGKKRITSDRIPSKQTKFVKIQNALEHNLKNLSVEFPLHALTVVTGVSGSGKSTLVRDILHKTITKYFDSVLNESGVSQYEHLSGDFQQLDGVEFVDQNPIGKSSRSNPATYLKIYDPIRKLFANQKLAKLHKYKPTHFSFNSVGGRCDECDGEGQLNIEMQFMADVHVECEECKGKRFKPEILEVKYKGKSIYDVLEMTVNQAYDFFKGGTTSGEKQIAKGLQNLLDVGLSYIHLGQASNTMSGGESQRIKLAYFLSKDKQKGNTLFIFDEPTTGLHFYDVDVLLKALNQLIERGNTVLVIEHNLDIIRNADYIIDMGPEGGDKGGDVVFQGTPDKLLEHPDSYTAKAMREGGGDRF